MMLWTERSSALTSMVIDLIIEALKDKCVYRDNMSVGPHQVKKLAASLAKYYLRCTNELLAQRMGNKTINTLLNCYIHKIPDVRVSCVVPLGTVNPI